MTYAPVALFVYKRLDHTKKAIESLRNADLSEVTDLYIFSDGAKNSVDANDVNRVRDYIRRVEDFARVVIVERDCNYGLSRSIVDGVTDLVEKYGKIIVLEDDLVVSKYFLKFMNTALNLYKNNNEVISIHGYVYPVDGVLPETFFLRGADCWGWATWNRGWRYYNSDGRALLQELYKKELSKLFDYDGAYPYLKMLKKQIRGKNNSWAIRWYASAFLANKLTLYPGYSLVRNIGNDSSGIHSRKSSVYDTDISDRVIKVGNIRIIESDMARELIKKYFKKSIYSRLKNKLLK